MAPFSKGSYDNNLNCQYDIKVNFGYGIRLQWEIFDVKGKMPNCYDDYIEIYIGCQRRSIGRYCSNNLGKNHLFTVYSPDNCLRIKFHSDSSGTGEGFEAQYSTFSLSFGNFFFLLVFFFTYIYIAIVNNYIFTKMEVASSGYLPSRQAAR